MQIARRNLGLILMYVGIICGMLTLTISQSTGNTDGFQAVSLDIAYVDMDNSSLSRGLIAFLQKSHTMLPMDNDPGKLQEALYYRDAAYVLKIPAGFSRHPKDTKLQITQVPGSSAGFYLNSQIDGFLQQTLLYEKGGFTEEQAVQMVQAHKSPAITIRHPQTGTNLTAFFQIIPYNVLCILCFTIGNVLCAYTRTEIKKRSSSGTLSPHRISMELLAAIGVFGLLIFLLMCILGTGFYGLDFWKNPNIGLHLLNTAAMILVSISIAYLISGFVRTPESLSGLINALSLGMSFLCGVFAPLELLGKQVQKVAQFLPFYWYEKACSLLSGSLSQPQMTDFFRSVGLQLLFTLAIIALGTTIHRKRA